MYYGESGQASKRDEARDLVKSSVFCCCHVRVFAVLLFLLSFFSFVAKYVLYAYDVELYQMFTLVGLDTPLYQGASVFIFFTIQAVILAFYFLALTCNSYLCVYPFIIFQMLLFIAQFSVALFYVCLSANGDLGIYRAAAIEAIKHLRFEIIEEQFQHVVSAGDYCIGLTIACGMSFLMAVNAFILAILQNFCAYLKLRSDYYSML